MPRYDALLRDARTRLPPGEAEILLAHAVGRDPTWLFAHGPDEADAREVEKFERLLARRVAGEPVAYLTGRRGFWTLDLDVTPDTLIPRPETERLVELALARIGDVARIADLGTGSGAIALAIASERPASSVIATDASVEALDVARANAARLGIANVSFRHGHWYAPLAGERMHIIASNPPYIASGDAHLARGDLRFEPAAALASGADGLDAIRELVSGAPAHLLPGGWLLVEHGFEQGDAVRELMRVAGLLDVETVRDLEQRDRVSLGRAPG